MALNHPGTTSLPRRIRRAVVLCFLVLVTCSPSSAHAKGEGTDRPPDAAAPLPEPALTAEQKLQIQAEVEKAKASMRAEMAQQNADNRSLIDRFVGITGLFTVIGALGAFFTLKSAREDARDQVASNAKLIQISLDTSKEKVQSAIESAQLKLDASSSGAQRKLDDLTAQVEEFKKKLTSELPEIRNLKEGLRELLQYLEGIIPGESNWNDGEPYDSLNVAQKENVLISEATVGALQIFVSPESPENQKTLMKLYCSLARFYFGRYRKQNRVEDIERAHVYVSKCVKIDGEHAEAHRLRGAFYLATFYLTKDGPSGPDKDILEKAELSLRTASKKNRQDLGAAYNLAFALASRAAISDALHASMDAIQRTIAQPETFPDYQIRKFAPSLVGNAGCYCCILASQSSDPHERATLHKLAADVIFEGYQLLVTRRHYPGILSLKALLVREFASTGDMHDLPPTERARLDPILNP